MQIHVPTLMLAILVLSAMLCVSTGWVARREGHDGLHPLTLALALHTLGYATFFVSAYVTLPVELFLRNAAITGAFCLMILALADFYKRPVSRCLLGVLALSTGVACALLTDKLAARILLSSSVIALLDAYMLAGLWRRRGAGSGRAQWLVMTGVAINLLIMLTRVVETLEHVAPLRAATDSTPMQGAVYISALVSLNLVAVGFVLMAKEASDEALLRQAMTDRLTGAWNRFRLESVAHQEILRLRRYGTPLSLMMIDIDWFKQINDQYGHLCGDAVLRELVARLQACVRETDIVGRWGGEEFVILLPSTGLHVAARVAERIRAHVAALPFAHGGAVTVSIGMASCRISDDWQDCLGRADAALYQAKDSGRNRVEADVPVELPRADADAIQGLLRLVWSDACTTGYAEIDAQHRQLFDDANRLLDLAMRGEDRVYLHEASASFMRNMEFHLHAEEAILADLRWDGLAEHAEQHALLLARSRQILDQYGKGIMEIAEVLHFIVYEVTAQHILFEDRKYCSMPAHSAAHAT